MQSPRRCVFFLHRGLFFIIDLLFSNSAVACQKTPGNSRTDLYSCRVSTCILTIILISDYRSLFTASCPDKVPFIF